MKVVEKAKATASLAKFTGELEHGAVVVTSHGKPIAALLPIENADLETVSLSTNPQFLELIERSRSRQRTEGSISSDEMRQRLGLNTSALPVALPQYWIVGAARKGQDDHYDDFVSRGYWKLFYRDDEQPEQALKRDQMSPGDRIAIKKMVGGKNGKGRVRIRAVGTILRVAQRGKRVSVRWERTDLDREILGHSLFKSVHGPFHADDEVVHDAFGEPLASKR